MNDAVAATLALLLAAAATGAVAQERKGPPHDRGQAIERMFEHLDADKNGTIETAEANAAWSKRFQRLDANADGKVTREEALAGRPERADRPGADERRKRAEEWRAKHFATLDSNGDGSVSLEEFQARQAQHFAKSDANADGKLTAQEMDGAFRRGHHEHKAK